MKKAILAAAVLLVGVPDLRAQATVTISAAGPGTNMGDLTVSGSYTVDGANGWTLGSILVTVWPVGGGEPNVLLPAVNQTNMTWTVTFTGLQSGQNYNVFADIAATKTGNPDYHACSAYTTGKAK